MLPDGHMPVDASSSSSAHRSSQTGSLPFLSQRNSQS